MKKYFLAIIFAILMCLAACGTETQMQEQTHLYWKDIDVTIIDIDKRHWFATTHRYVVELTVKSEEYGLVGTFEIYGAGIFGCPKEWNYDEGQVIKAQLYSWVMDSTGEVVRREIDRIY